MVLALPTPPTLLRLPPRAVVVVEEAGCPVATALRLLVLLPERDVLALERLAVLVPVLLEREVLTPERLLLELLLEREVLALEREALELEREVLEMERLAELPEERLLLELLLERLMVPPCALELLNEELIELREELEEDEPLDALEPEEERLLLALEVERLLLDPPRDWALTGAIASAIAAMAASAILNVVFIMLNFSVRKFNYSF